MGSLTAWSAVPKGIDQLHALSVTSRVPVAEAYGCVLGGEEGRESDQRQLCGLDSREARLHSLLDIAIRVYFDSPLQVYAREEVMTLLKVGLTLGKESARGEAEYKCNSNLNTVEYHCAGASPLPRRFDWQQRQAGVRFGNLDSSPFLRGRASEPLSRSVHSSSPATRPDSRESLQVVVRRRRPLRHAALDTGLDSTRLESLRGDTPPPKMTTTMSNMGKSVMRVAKNSIKGYSDTQTKIRDATSNDPWGPSGTQMAELAQLTYNQQDFVEIIEMLEKRLNDKGKNWRHVFKSLTVLDYILHAGSENVVHYFRYVHCGLIRGRFSRAQCLTAPLPPRPPRQREPVRRQDAQRVPVHRRGRQGPGREW